MQEQANTVAGTLTLNNKPPSRNTTLEDLIQMDWLNVEAMPIGDLTDTLGEKRLATSISKERCEPGHVHT